MPAPVPDAGPRLRMSRRRLLLTTAAMGAGTLAACTAERPERPRTGPSATDRSARSGTEPVDLDPDIAVAIEALTAQRAAVDLLTATADRHRTLTTLLASPRRVHEAHAAMLEDAVPEELRPSPAGSPSPTAAGSPGHGPSAGTSPSPGTGGRRTRVPRNRRRALVQVLESEQALVVTTKQQAFSAQSGEFARLLGSMAAAAAQQARLLAEAEAAPQRGGRR